MFFSKGGMKLIDDEGNITQANPGEFIFILKTPIPPKPLSSNQVYQ